MPEPSDSNAISIEYAFGKPIIRDHAGTVISGTCDIIDWSTGTRLASKALGPVGVRVDIYIRASDQDGLTMRDGLAVGRGVLAGYGADFAMTITEPTNDNWQFENTQMQARELRGQF